jgi:hypothetical protein
MLILDLRVSNMSVTSASLRLRDTPIVSAVAAQSTASSDIGRMTTTVDFSIRSEYS